MILIVIPIDKYNLFRDCDFVNPLENNKYINKTKKKTSCIFEHSLHYKISTHQTIRTDLQEMKKKNKQNRNALKTKITDSNHIT